MQVIDLPKQTDEYLIYGLIKNKKVFYVGCTSNIIQRIGLHSIKKVFDSYCVLGGDDDLYSARVLETEMMEIYQTGQKKSSAINYDLIVPVYIVQPEDENKEELIKLRQDMIEIKKKIAKGLTGGKTVYRILKENNFSRYKYYRFRDMRKIPKGELMKYRSKEKITPEMDEYISKNFKTTSKKLSDELEILFGIRVAITTITRRKHKIAKEQLRYPKRRTYIEIANNETEAIDTLVEF